MIEAKGIEERYDAGVRFADAIQRDMVRIKLTSVMVDDQQRGFEF